MSSPNKPPRLREFNEAQAAKVLPKNTSSSPKFNIEDLTISKPSQLPQEEIDRYLEYCRKVFPCKDNKFGVIFAEDIAVQKALEILHKCNYDVPKAKFLVTYPALSKYCLKKNIQLDPNIDYQGLIDNFAFQKTLQFSTREKTLFDELNRKVQEATEKLLYRDIEELVQEGVKKHFVFPEPLRAELSKAETMGSEIVDCLVESKVYNRVCDIFTRCQSLIIVPKNADDLYEIKRVYDDVIERAQEFTTSEEKDIKAMQKLLADIKLHDLDCNSTPLLSEFQSFAQKTNSIMEKIQILSRPYRGKESGQKFSLEVVFEIMDFFQIFAVKNEKNVADLAFHVYRMEIEKENCLMFLEDDKENEVKNFGSFVDDLKKSAIDYDEEIAMIELKIQSIETFKYLTKQMRNERLIQDNLERITAFEKTGSAFYRKHMQEIKETLINFQTIDSKVEKIERSSISIIEFLSEEPAMVQSSEIIGMLEDMKARSPSLKDFPFVQQITNYVSEFEELSRDPVLLNSTELSFIIQQVKKMIEFGLTNEVLVPQLKEKVMDALDLEYFIVKFLDKFTFEKTKFAYPEFESLVRSGFKGLPSFDFGLEMVMDDLQNLFNDDLKNFVLLYRDKREAINSTLDSPLASKTLTEDNLAEIESYIKATFKDKELLIKLKIITESKKRQSLLEMLESRLEKDYVAYSHLEQAIHDQADNYQGSQDFFADNYDALVVVYNRASEYKEEITKEEIDELFGLLAKQMAIKDEIHDEFFSRIKQLKEIIHKNSLEFANVMKHEEKEEARYVLKVPSLILMYYKISCLGVRPEFLKNIEYFLTNYFEIDEYLNPQAKKTLREIRHTLIKYSELRLFSPSVKRLKELVRLAATFKESVHSIESKFSGNTITSNEMLDNVNKNVDLDDYDLEIVQNSITLTRRKFMPLENKEFQNFLNSAGKRVKKFKAMPETVNPEETELNDPASIRSKKVVPIYFFGSEEFCMCRESFEIKSMMQYNICSEWFHQECIKMPSHLIEKNKDDYCFGCDYLNAKPSDKANEFLGRKISDEKFNEILRSYFLLKDFLVDEEVDFVGYLVRKTEKLTAEIEEAERLIESLDKELATKAIHNSAILYLYIPVELSAIKGKIFDLHKKCTSIA
jgi:hypothetical protein